MELHFFGLWIWNFGACNLVNIALSAEFQGFSWRFRPLINIFRTLESIFPCATNPYPQKVPTDNYLWHISALRVGEEVAKNPGPQRGIWLGWAPTSGKMLESHSKRGLGLHLEVPDILLPDVSDQPIGKFSPGDWTFLANVSKILFRVGFDSSGRGRLGEGRLGLPGQVWEFRFLPSFGIPPNPDPHFQRGLRGPKKTHFPSSWKREFSVKKSPFFQGTAGDMGSFWQKTPFCGLCEGQENGGFRTPKPSFPGNGGFGPLSGFGWIPSLFLDFLGKVAVQKLSGKTPGSPRHLSSRHPRPSGWYSPTPQNPFKC